MEDYLNNLNSLKACYEKQSFEQVMSLSKDEIRTLCVEERLKVIRDLTSDRLLTSNIIHERIRILQDRENAKVQNRREALDKKFL
jgi:hypothetical protein